MDVVLLPPPYTAAAVRGLPAATPAQVQRVGKVVQGWRAKEGLGAAIDAALAQ